jgi:hypothetical protein
MAKHSLARHELALFPLMFARLIRLPDNWQGSAGYRPAIAQPDSASKKRSEPPFSASAMFSPGQPLNR